MLMLFGRAILELGRDELFASEARHYRVLFDLATRVLRGDEERVRARLAVLAEAEGALAGRLGRTAAIHG